MREQMCPYCGAINHLNADACWRCLDPFPAPETISVQAEPEADPQTATG